MPRAARAAACVAHAAHGGHEGAGKQTAGPDDEPSALETSVKDTRRSHVRIQEVLLYVSAAGYAGQLPHLIARDRLSESDQAVQELH